MARRMFTMWVVAVAAAVLTACGAPVQSSEVGTTDGTVREAPTGDEEQAEPDVPEEEADPGGDPTQEGDDGGTPWHLLPEDDRPVPVEQPECDRASLSPVAC